MKAARLALGALIVTGLAPGQSLKDRQERFFTASCQAVWQHAVRAFGEKGFDPEQMDRDSGFMKFEYSRGTITRNVRGHLQAWTYSKGSWLNEALRVDGATLMLTDEAVGCQVKAKIKYALLRKPFLANQYSWVVATSNGWVEKQILDAIAEANPESTNQSLPTGSANTGRPSDSRAPVEITSTPSRADIEVNGAFSGMTPATKKLKEGTYRITVRKANYRIWERNVKVEPGDSLTLHAELQSVMTERIAPAAPDEQPPPVEDEPPAKKKSGIKIIRN